MLMDMQVFETLCLRDRVLWPLTIPTDQHRQGKCATFSIRHVQLALHPVYQCNVDVAGVPRLVETPNEHGRGTTVSAEGSKQ